MDLPPHLDFGQHIQKAVREFLRAADVILSLMMRQAEDGGCSPHELRMILGYVASLKAHILQVETAERLTQSQDCIAPPGEDST
jgi:hypothetical protein